MPKSTSKSRSKKPPEGVLALPDLEQAKAAVLNSLTYASGQRTYDHATTEFVEWYCRSGADGISVQAEAPMRRQRHHGSRARTVSVINKRRGRTAKVVRPFATFGR